MTKSTLLSRSQKAREYARAQEACHAPYWGRVGDKNLPVVDTPLSGGVLLALSAGPISYGPLFSPFFLRHGPAPERVDHDVVGNVCVLLYSVLVVQCFHAGSRPTLRQARPTFDRVHRTNDVHARSRVALECAIRLIRVVDDAWYNDRRRAVLQQVGALGKSLPGSLLLQEVIDGPGHAVALRLPGHDHDIECEQLFDELDVLPPEAIAVRSLGHLGAEHRIVLGKGVVPFDLELGLAVAGDAVKEDGFLDRRDEGVPDATEHGVIGPDSQVVLAALGQAARVVSEVALGVIDVDLEGLGDCGVHSPAASLDVISRDERIGRRVLAVLVDEPDRVEDLHRMVGVEARKDLRDCAEVAVDELAQTTVVVDCARARSPGDEELEVRDAERVLDVDGEEAEAKGVLCRWAHTVLVGPRLSLTRAVLVWDPPSARARVAPPWTVGQIATSEPTLSRPRAGRGG